MDFDMKFIQFIYQNSDLLASLSIGLAKAK
jgi:hypothetical protein